jgi:hypothetical protein
MKRMSYAVKEIYLWLMSKDKSDITEVVQFEREGSIEVRIKTRNFEYRYYVHQGGKHVC